MSKQKLSEDKRKLVLELHNQGLTQKRVGEMIGIKQSCVSTVLTSMRVVSRPRRIGKDLIVAFVKDYKDGKTLEEIADCYCVSTNTIRKHLKYNGVKFPKGKLNEDDKGLMIKLQNEGKGFVEISKELKRDRRTVRKYLNERGNNNVDEV